MAMSKNPLVTDEDRQRGWAELEIILANSITESVRVHALEPADITHLVTLRPAVALTEGLVKSLRADKDFVARITPESQIAIMAALAMLMHGNDEGQALADVSAAVVYAYHFGALPETAAEVRETILSAGPHLALWARFESLVQPFKEAQAVLLKISKISPPPKYERID